MIGAPFIGELVWDLIGIFAYLTVQVRPFSVLRLKAANDCLV